MAWKISSSNAETHYATPSSQTRAQVDWQPLIASLQILHFRWSNGGARFGRVTRGAGRSQVCRPTATVTLPGCNTWSRVWQRVRDVWRLSCRRAHCSEVELKGRSVSIY